MAGLKRLTDATTQVGSKIAQPGDSEVAGIKAREDAENEYLNAIKATMPSNDMGKVAPSAPATVDEVNPMAKYGDRGREQRIDTSSYTKPLSGTPVYDRGGVVGQAPKETIADPQMETNKIYHQDGHRMRPVSDDQPIQYTEVTPQQGQSSDLQKRIPVYDQGGNVDQSNINDGQHQVAVLENGERVLTPAQNQQYEAEQAAKQQTVSPTAEAQQSAKLKPMATVEQPAAKEAPKVGPPAVGQGANTGEDQITEEAKGAKLRPLSAGAEETAPIPKGPDVMTSGKVDASTLGGNPAQPAPGTPVHPFGPQMTGTDEYHHHLQDLKDRMEQGFQNKDYVMAGNAKMALNELEKANPRGSEYNHPGLLGKIEHGLSIAGQVAAQSVLGPGIVASIPGTRMNLSEQARQGETLANAGVKQGLEKEQTALAHKQANAPDSPEQQLIDAQDQARTNPTPENQQKVTDLQAIIDKGKTPPPDKLNQQLFDAEQKRDATAPGTPEREAADQEVANLKDSIGAGKNAANPNAEANRERAQAVIAQVGDLKNADGSLKYPGVNKPENQVATLQKALKNGDISDAQYQAYSGWEGTQGSAPAAAITVKNEGAQTSENIKDADKTYAINDPDHPGNIKWVTGDKVPPGAEKEEIKDLNSEIATARAGNTVQEALNKLSKDIDDYPIIWDDPVARDILATATSGDHAQHLGFLVAGTGGSLQAPAGVSKMIDTFLQSKGVSGKEKEGLEHYISDYINAKDKASLIQQELQGGKIGRQNQKTIDAIFAQLPDGSAPDSTEARRRLENIQQTHTQASTSFPEKYLNYTKEKPYTPKSQQGQNKTIAADRLPAGVPKEATHVYYKKGQPGVVAGYALNGKYVSVAK